MITPRRQRLIVNITLRDVSTIYVYLHLGKYAKLLECYLKPGNPS